MLLSTSPLTPLLLTSSLTCRNNSHGGGGGFNVIGFAIWFRDEVRRSLEHFTGRAQRIAVHVFGAMHRYGAKQSVPTTVHQTGTNSYVIEKYK